jgi:tRNA-(ms[2]io[6]A)-hydroxylase
MLGLMTPTDPAWVEAAEAQLDALLQDHAQCELKAAHTALSLLGRFAAEQPALVEPLVALAQEEADHYRQVTRRLQARGTSLGMPDTDSYVSGLMEAARGNRHDGVPVLLDRLLVAALIEGRSCERFRLLSEGLSDVGLRAFYRELMASEARHFTLFSGLAGECFGAEAARARFETLAEREARLVRATAPSARVHG